MNFRTIFLFAIVGLLLVSSLDAAKQKGGKGKKGSAVKADKVKAEKVAKVAKTPKAEKVAKVEKTPKAEKVVKEKPVKAEKAPKVEKVEEPVIVRPKNLKVITAYDKCKMDCQKIRDQQDLHSYAAQLRDELIAAEAALEAAAQVEEA
ncbi:hypothetical protein PFISCL1PPCAC_27290, partial [Pristionchus fissidentatus]